MKIRCDPEIDSHKYSKLIFNKGAKVIQGRKKKSLQQMMPEQMNINMQKKKNPQKTMNLDTNSTFCIKIYSKWTKDLKVKDKIIKLEENLGDLGLGNEILDKTKKHSSSRKK